MQVKSSPKAQNFLSSSAGTRFRKLVGMLGSSHAGEAGNAAVMATRLLVEAGITWGEVVGAGTSAGSSFSQESFTRRIRELEQQLIVQRSATSRLESDRRAAAQAHDKLQKKFQALESELREAKRVLEVSGISSNGPNASYAKDTAPSQSGLRTGKFTSPLQRELNRLADDITTQADLNDWSTSFLTSIRELKWKLTEKQRAKLAQLAEDAELDIREYALD